MRVECPHSKKCSDFRKACCGHCANNEFRSYYRPVYELYAYPWYHGPSWTGDPIRIDCGGTSSSGLAIGDSASGSCTDISYYADVTPTNG